VIKLKINQTNIMNKASVFLLACCLAQALARGQGVVFFSNLVRPSMNDPIGVEARIYNDQAAPLTTPPWSAALVLDESGTLSVVPGSITSFRTGPAAGYVNPLIIEIPNHTGGSRVTLQIMAFLGATESDAAAALGLRLGLSNAVDVTLGGGAVLPPDLVGLTSFIALTPEPGTLAIIFLGAVVLTACPRKRR
jgi:hypothetical protein